MRETKLIAKTAQLLLVTKNQREKLQRLKPLLESENLWIGAQSLRSLSTISTIGQIEQSLRVPLNTLLNGMTISIRGNQLKTCWTSRTWWENSTRKLKGRCVRPTKSSANLKLYASDRVKQWIRVASRKTRSQQSLDSRKISMTAKSCARSDGKL